MLYGNRSLPLPAKAMFSVLEWTNGIAKLEAKARKNGGGTIIEHDADLLELLREHYLDIVDVSHD